MPLPRLLRALTLAAVAPLAASAQSYQWSAFAGLPPQYGSADGNGTDARFFAPYGLVATTAGVVYVCDANNFTIRRIAANGDVTTFAGAPGQRGAVDGTGNAARFGYPSSLTIVNGLLYVTDSANHAVRRINGAGAVTTVAGALGLAGAADGSAANARFNSPSAIDFDSAGNVFVADTGNHVIRKIAPSGEVSTFAGQPGVAGSADGSGTVASFNRPGGLFVGAGNALYVADTYNHTIRRITPDGTVTTLAGRAGSPGAVNAPGTAARFRFPRGLLVFNDGTILVADQTHTIRQIAPDGTVGTYAGRLDVQGSRDGPRTDARFYVPLGLAFTADGFVVSDSFNHSVRKVVTASGTVSTLAGTTGNFGRQDGLGPAARFNFPSGVAVHASGDVYLADSRGNAIRRISPAGQVVRVAGAATGDDYIDGPPDVQSLNYPHGLAVAPDRTIYFCEQQRHTIRVVRPDGSVSTLAGRMGASGAIDGAGDAARFNFPSGIALDRDGNLYIADSANYTIRRIAAGTNVVTTFAGAALAAGSADGTTAARFRLPLGVATDAAGNVYVADTSNHTIRRITRAGEVSTLAGLALADGAVDGPLATARFSLPFALAIDAQGALFVADSGTDIVRRISGGNVSTIGGVAEVQGFQDGAGSAALFHNPSGIAVDAGGTLYVSESGNNIVRRGDLLAAPAIATQPRSVAAPAGSIVTLSVAATGGALSYQWRLNGTPIPGATAASYTIPAASAATAGDYTVVVANLAGTTTSQAATVTVVAVSDSGRIVNLSILTAIPASGDTFKLGFVIGGGGTSGRKPLVIRAAGPSLGALGVPGTLDDPKLELFTGPNKTGENDNWGGSPALAAAMRNVGAFEFTGPGSRDAAVAADFSSGDQTVSISAAGSGTGAVIAEIYDATPSAAFGPATPRLVNVSVLKHLGAGLTAGFVIDGGGKTVLIRAIGPTLGAAFNLPGVVADPRLTLYAGSAVLARNDNWGGTPELAAAFAQVGAFPLDPASRDAALVARLPAGSYTVEVSGVGETTGVALVEVYEVP